MATVLVVGCGYVGQPLCAQLVARGDQVYTLTRSGRADVAGAVSLQGDVGSLDDVSRLPKNIENVVYIVSAGEHTPEAYRHAYVTGIQCLLQALMNREKPPSRLVYISSTSVYGQTDGSRVDETSPTNPANFGGQLILEGEKAVLGAQLEGIVLRLGGIYGPGRDRMIRQVADAAVVELQPETTYTNRNHRDDCAGQIIHLLELEDPQSIYVGVDHDPADRNDVVKWLARRLGKSVQEASVGSFVAGPSSGQPNPAKARRYGGSKRCVNKRLIDSGYVFKYPSFKEGYESILLSMGL